MNNNDKEFLLSVLDDMAVVLAQYEAPETTWNKLNRAMTIVERSLNEKKPAAETLNFHDWHEEQELDLSDDDD